MSTEIPTSVSKRAIFEQEFRAVVETKNIFSPVATKLVSRAKNITSPFTGVGVAKAHTQDCRVPLSDSTLGTDELVLDRLIGNAIRDCREELSYAQFDIIGSYRRDLYASVIKKANTEALTDFLADATVVSGTVDLSTAEKVAEFLISVKATAEQSVGLRQNIDGATIVRAERHGQAFVAAGSTAYVAIVSKIASIVGQSSLKGLADGNMVETPYGVVVINLAETATDPKQLLYGTAGVPTMAYREDQIEVKMGEMTSVVTYSGSADLDIVSGDEMLENTWYMYAQTKGKNGIFSNVASLVSKQLMA